MWCTVGPGNKNKRTSKNDGRGSVDDAVSSSYLLIRENETEPSEEWNHRWRGSALSCPSCLMNRVSRCSWKRPFFRWEYEERWVEIYAVDLCCWFRAQDRATRWEDVGVNILGAKIPIQGRTCCAAHLAESTLTLLNMSLYSEFQAKFHSRSFIAALTLLNRRSAPFTAIHTLDSVDEFHRNNVEQKEIQFLRIMLTLYCRFGYYTRNAAYKSWILFLIFVLSWSPV